MEPIYHGCYFRNADGTNKRIRIGKKSLVPTNECFWIGQRDVKNEVKTRSCTKSELFIGQKTIEQHQKQKQFIGHWIKENNKRTTDFLFFIQYNC